MYSNECPNCLGQLIENDDGSMTCSSCNTWFDVGEVEELWEEKLDREEAERNDNRYKLDMIKEGKMNSAGEWIDEDGDLLYTEWYPDD